MKSFVFSMKWRPISEKVGNGRGSTVECKNLGTPGFNCLFQFICMWSKANLNSEWHRVKHETFLLILKQDCLKTLIGVHLW